MGTAAASVEVSALQFPGFTGLSRIKEKLSLIDLRDVQTVNFYFFIDMFYFIGIKIYTLEDW